MGIRASIFLVILLGLCSVAICDEANLEAEDVRALMVQNARAPQTLRVAWRIESRDAQGSIAFYRNLAEKLKAEIESGNASPEDLVRFKSDITRAEAKAQDRRTEFAFYDYWTDFTRFQNRAKRTESGGPVGFSKPAGGKFPDLIPNFTELPQYFNDTMVLSYGPETDYAFRLWQASLRQPPLGVVSIQSPWFSQMHPPLVMPPTEWGGKLHPVDDFLALLAIRGEVVAAVEFNGAPHLLVFATDGERSMRAFLSLDQGCVPSRIESYLWVLDPNLYRKTVVSDVDSQLTANFITECSIDSSECSSGVYYYPSKGVLSTIAYSPSPEYAVSPAQNELAVHHETIWEYVLLECDREMVSKDFRLTFSPGMVYIDHARNGTFVTGDAEGAMKQIANGAIQFGQRRDHWIIWVGVIFALLMASATGLFVFRRRRLAC